MQNIGGIANLTAIPAGASAQDVLAFDTGPGNMVIDAVTDHLFGKPYDRDGKIAASGTVLEQRSHKFCVHHFFFVKPAENRRARRVWTRVCPAIPETLRTGQ